MSQVQTLETGVSQVNDINTALRDLPSIDVLLLQDQAIALEKEFGRTAVRAVYQQAVQEEREKILSTKNTANVAATGNAEKKAEQQPIKSANNSSLQNGHSHDLSDKLHQLAATLLQDSLLPSLKPVYNVTGTVLHTNLGRSLLPAAAIEAMNGVASQPCNLEYNISNGKRGQRDHHVEQLLCELTGAEAATVVNNNAAAVLLVLNAMAEGGSVAVSRGELVEIGGSFRVPDIMKKAGCHLYEVGTTNRTHLYDFERALDDDAAAVMRVHTSNYRIEGFSTEVPEAQLASLCHDRGVPFMNDLGSGLLVDLSQFDLPTEPTVREAVESGADVVTFSGDKLLGGPQCGLIVGRKELIDKINANPLKRALRCDKLTLAALQVLLQLYSQPERLQEQVPALRLITRKQLEIRLIAEQVLPSVADYFSGNAKVRVEDSNSQIGSGALPVESLASCSIVLAPSTPGSGDQSSKVSPNSIARQLRELPTPVIGRIHKDEVWLDMRCIEDTDSFIANFQSKHLH